MLIASGDQWKLGNFVCCHIHFFWGDELLIEICDSESTKPPWVWISPQLPRPFRVPEDLHMGCWLMQMRYLNYWLLWSFSISRVTGRLCGITRTSLKKRVCIFLNLVLLSHLPSSSPSLMGPRVSQVHPCIQAAVHASPSSLALGSFLDASVACPPGVREAGKCECWTEGSDWGTQEWEAAFDIHAQPSSAHMYCPGSEWEDSRRWEKPLYPTDKRRNIAELSSRGMGATGESSLNPHFIPKTLKPLESCLPVYL